MSRRRNRNRSVNTVQSRSYAHVLYNRVDENLWASVIFQDANHVECGRTRPFILQKGLYDPAVKQGVHGTLWIRLRRALDLINEYRDEKEKLHKAISSISDAPRSTVTAQSTRTGENISIVTPLNPEADNLLVKHELYAERCMLLVGVYTRTIFEQLQQRGQVTIPLRDENLHEVPDQQINLHNFSHILVHHRSSLVQRGDPPRFIFGRQNIVVPKEQRDGLVCFV